MHRLENVIQHYAWGSRRALAAMQGRAVPTEKPEAELWLGAHPSAPSRLADSHEPLSTCVEKDPQGWLGSAVLERFAGRFPYLLKVLAAEEPLSLQAHPSLAQARAGFANEEARAVPRTAAHRNYKDDNHKPELICALTPFTALYGFRAPEQTRSLLEALAVPRLSPAVEALGRGEEGLRTAFEWLMTLPAEHTAQLVGEALGAAERVAASHDAFALSCRWAVTLGQKYPGDIGCVSSLLLNCLELAPMEALFLPAGNLHAYLQGVGVEIMASSDNVLRGGLTQKHVDVPELLRVLDFHSIEGRPQKAEASSPHEQSFRTSAPEFELSILSEGTVSARRGPDILLCTSGTVRVTCNDVALTLTSGESAVIAAHAPSYNVRGTGSLFRAQVGSA